MTMELPSDFVVKVRAEMAKRKYHVTDYNQLLTPVGVADCLSLTVDMKKDRSLDATSVIVDQMTRGLVIPLMRDTMMMATRLQELEEGAPKFHEQEETTLRINSLIMETRLAMVQEIRARLHLRALDEDNPQVSALKVETLGEMAFYRAHHELSKTLIDIWVVQKRKAALEDDAK